MEVESITDPVQKIPMEKSLIALGKWMILNRENIGGGAEVVNKYKELVKG